MALLLIDRRCVDDDDAESQPNAKVRSADVKTCRVCADEVGTREDGQPFVACTECGFPVCRPCYEYERSEGTQCCPQCNTRYKRHKGRFSTWVVGAPHQAIIESTHHQ